MLLVLVNRNNGARLCSSMLVYACLCLSILVYVVLGRKGKRACKKSSLGFLFFNISQGMGKRRGSQFGKNQRQRGNPFFQPPKRGQWASLTSAPCGWRARPVKDHSALNHLLNWANTTLHHNSTCFTERGKRGISPAPRDGLRSFTCEFT
jgi:hypothetical protein